MFDWFKKLFSHNPVNQRYGMPTTSKTAGTFRRNYRDWIVNKNTLRSSDDTERDLSASRVEQLFWDDGTTRSVINSLTTNVIGRGLQLQSILPYKRLGITQEKARDLQEQIEWLFYEWSLNCHYRGQESFGRLQNIGFQSLIKYGEFIHLPIKVNDGSKFSFKIQDIAPSRLRTPFDRFEDQTIHDGVEVDQYGVPIAYWILSPKINYGYIEPSSLTAQEYERYLAQLEYGRKGVYHVFKSEQEEQYRGISPLVPVLNFLRNFSDSIDNELMCQISASNFAVFIAMQNGAAPGLAEGLYNENSEYEQLPNEPRFYQDIQGGQIMYGNPGEKPEVIENARPSGNFLNFCQLLLRMIGANLELPYEVISKDFSKTNYSSARAALLEAWRVYEIYRDLMINQYCQPVYKEFLIEAYAKRYIKLPCTPKDFLNNINLWTNARWIGPSKGYIDPENEAKANILLIQAGLVSRSEIIAERGGDFDEVTQTLSEEQKMREKLGLKDEKEEKNNEFNQKTKRKDEKVKKNEEFKDEK